MSKYIKLEDLKWHSPDESIVKPLIEFYITENDIADLPTIEVNEDCDSCIWNSCNYNKVPWEVSEDAISRDYVRLIESDEDAYFGDWNETYERGFLDAINKVLNAPSVLPKPKEGEWVEIGLATHSYKCSVCGRMLMNITDGKKNVAKNYPYCHCGAKMKGADDE